MDQTSYLTAGGIRVHRTAEPFDPAELDGLTRQVQDRPGRRAQLGHGVPGPVQPLAHGLHRSAGRDRGPRPPGHRDRPERARRGAAAGHRGRAGPGRARGLGRHVVETPGRRRPSRPDRVAEVVIPAGHGVFAEEDRSRRPTVFTAIRRDHGRASPGRTRTWACTARSVTTWPSSSSPCGSG